MSRQILLTRVARPVTASVLVLGFCSPAAWAGIPACALHLAQPAPGAQLTPAQIAANQSCIAELHQEDAAAGLVEKIWENDKKMLAPEPGTPAAAARAPQAPALPAPPIAALTTGDPRTAPPHGMARVALIMTDGAQVEASLTMPEGGTMDVTKGTTLPDGSVVAEIRPNAVYVRREGHMQRLELDDGSAPAQAASSVQPIFRFPVAAGGTR